MSTIGTVNPMNELAKTLVQRFDTNRDGTLTTDEFASFLASLLSGISGTAQTDPDVPTKTGGTPSPTTLFADPVSPRSRLGLMAGFSETKLGDTSHLSFKYQIGRILQYYPNTPDGLRQALPEIQQLVPGATIVGAHGDTIDFGDYQDPKSGRIGAVDVLVAAAIGGRSWAWQPLE